MADNLQYKGHLDRIYLATGETWEMDYFVNRFLTENGYNTSEGSKNTIRQLIQQYKTLNPGKNIHREAINFWLKTRLVPSK